MRWSRNAPTARPLSGFFGGSGTLPAHAIDEHGTGPGYLPARVLSAAHSESTSTSGCSCWSTVSEVCVDDRSCGSIAVEMAHGITGALP